MPHVLGLTHAIVHLARLEDELEQASLAAFQAFEQQYSTLSVAVVDRLTSRQKAARWMMLHRRAFEGRSAFELALEGDIDRVWDLVCPESDDVAPVVGRAVNTEESPDALGS